MLNKIQLELQIYIRLCILLMPTKYMSCGKPVQCKWYISFHSVTWFHGLDVTTLNSRIRHYSGSFFTRRNFPRGAAFTLFKNQLTESRCQKTRQNIIPRGKFCQVKNNGLRVRQNVSETRCSSAH